MKILVTGGAGFVGSHVVDRYIAEGHEVVIVDDLSSGTEENINPKARHYQIDIRSNEMEMVFRSERPDVVNHHAAQKSVPKSVEDPSLDAEINVIGLLNLLENSVKYNVKKFIYVSSGGALVGDAKTIPTDESIKPKLISPYAITKFTGELYLDAYFQLHGLQYLVLRYANVYGPRQIPEGECGVIPIFFENYLAQKESILMAYADQPKGTTRDYVYIDDIAEANALALYKGENEVLNIGSGIEIHIEDIYYTMQEVFGHHLPLIRQGERQGDVKRSCLDSMKARQVLGWEPKIPLKEGLRKLKEQYKRNTLLT